jgi:hypothetical protein
MAEFSARGFSSVKAIANLVHEKTGTPFFQVYRALLYMATSQKYFDLLEVTIEKIKEE